MAKNQKYKKGDKVKVRDDLRLHKRYFMEDGELSDTVVKEMKQFRGKIVTISEDDGMYRIEEDPSFWNWTDEMFESEEKGE